MNSGFRVWASYDKVLGGPVGVHPVPKGVSGRAEELLWIERTTRRFDGYNYFGQHPEKMLAWFAKYMKS